ncbi:MAG: hypothetical protein JST01_14460 [Cyanobacteria bacterium SZAS TMP-1]|nr:hypothetical protein [Cyanobacteria bacterium SZAS TMP-1]
MATKDPKKEQELKDLKQYEVKTGIPFADAPLNHVDLNKDGLPDVPQLMRFYAEYGPKIAPFIPLLEELLKHVDKTKAMQEVKEFVAHISFIAEEAKPLVIEVIDKAIALAGEAEAAK